MEDADRRVRCRSAFSGYDLCLLSGGDDVNEYDRRCSKRSVCRIAVYRLPGK